eukprot:11156316-Prorocentrum_lima.AAC.1
MLLVGEPSIRQLVEQLTQGEAGSVPKAVTWNLRWLRDPHTPQSRAKARKLQGLLDCGSVVMIQETHWEPGR